MNTLSYILRDIAVVAVAYLVGSVPFSYIFAKVMTGVDITKVGSKNMGATNVLRAAGPVPAMFAFAGDFLKSALLLVALERFIPNIPQDTVLVAAVVVVLGHDFSILVGFKGGKGVATTFGVVVVLSWPVALVESGIWLLAMVLRNTVSLASVAVFATLPVVALLLRQPLQLVLIYSLLAVLGIVRHAANIRRLRAGQEPKLDRSCFRRR